MVSAMGADSTNASRRLAPGSTRMDFWFSCVTAESMVAAPRRVVQAELAFSKEARNNGVAAGSGARESRETRIGARRSCRISYINITLALTDGYFSQETIQIGRERPSTSTRQTFRE